MVKISLIYSVVISPPFKKKINSNNIFPSYDVIESPIMINGLHIELLDVFHELENPSHKTAIDGLSPIYLSNCGFVFAPPINIYLQYL